MRQCQSCLAGLDLHPSATFIATFYSTCNCFPHLIIFMRSEESVKLSHTLSSCRYGTFLAACYMQPPAGSKQGDAIKLAIPSISAMPTVVPRSEHSPVSFEGKSRHADQQRDCAFSVSSIGFRIWADLPRSLKQYKMKQGLRQIAERKFADIKSP